MEKVHPTIPSQLREQLRATFTEDAELYDRCRPQYPLALFIDLATLARLGPHSRVLEIGPGTGQATLPLAKLGCHITGVEFGNEMAVVARRNLSTFSRVEIVVSPFEDWPIPEQKFDLVVSANAFHWVDENVRMVKAADALEEEQGMLAVVSTHHVKGGTEAFFDEVQRLYEKFGVAPVNGLCLPVADDIPEDAEEFEREKCFAPVGFWRYEWEETYSTEQYLDVLLTYSSHRCLEEDTKERLLASIANLIDSKYEGRITKQYMVQMAVAKRLPRRLRVSTAQGRGTTELGWQC
jgi:ubiquinone/menaquinone biosynthesis C-methylase UbiE